MEKFVVVIMGDKCSKFLDMCFQSVINSEKIIFCWGEEDKNTLNKFKEWKEKYLNKFELISLKYDQNNPKQNGITRNFYLNHVKENYQDYWCLAIDADEVVEDLSKIKEFIQTAPPMIYGVHMRHFIGDLGHEDFTKEKHYVKGRLFKINEAKEYPLIEHPVLQPFFDKKDFINKELKDYKIFSLKESEDGDYGYIGETDVTTIWHLAYIPNLWDIKKRYENHMKKSTTHTHEFLDNWKDAHILGHYPKKEVNVTEIPNIILKEFNINKDKYYFKDRNIEVKHFVDAYHWKKTFKLDENKSIIEFGCGKGPRIIALKMVGCNATGIEKSEYAVENSFDKEDVKVGDVLTYNDNITRDLIVAYDLLEHINYEDLNKAIQTLVNHICIGGHILISVPTIGDPNLLADKTHIIKESKDWWQKKIESFGIKIIETPEHFLFKEQILVGVKDGS